MNLKLNKHLLFIGALLLQTVILLSMPFGKYYTLTTGEEIRLQLAPVDPFDMWSGYFVVLRYDVSRPDSLAGWHNFKEGDTVFVGLQKASDGSYKAQSLSKTQPATKPFLKGKVEDAELKFGIETYFIPEARRSEIQQNIDANRGQGYGVIAVDGNGNAALKHLLIKDQVYAF